MLSFKEFLYESFQLDEGALKYPDAIKHVFSYTKAFIDKIKKGEDMLLAGGGSVRINYDDTVRTLESHISTGEDVISFLKSKSTFFESDDGRQFKWTHFDKAPFSGVKMKFNRGDLAEGIVSAAITAKFLKPDAAVSVIDVQDILRNMKKSGCNDYVWAVNADNNTTDKVTLKITLKPNSAKALYDEGNWPFLADEFMGAVAYANSKNVERYAKLINHNSTNDTVIVSSEGAVDEKLTKVDLSVMIGLDGREPKPTKLNLSLKAGKTKNLEQAGVTFNKVSETFEKFGIDISGMASGFKKEEEWYKEAFTYAVLYLNKHLTDDRSEADIVRKIANGLQKASTKGDDSVIQVQIDGGKYKVYSFKNLEERLSKYELEAYMNTRAARPQFGIRDSKTKEDLVTFRIEVRSGNIIYKMHIEKGTLLTKLAER